MRVNKKVGITLALLMLAAVTVLIAGTSKVYAGNEKRVDVLFTHDIHSYLTGYEDVNAQGEIVEVGGLARLSTFIQNEKEKKPDILVLDAGDIAMGTLYQTVFSTDALELRSLGIMGYDATTIGNHEFDYGTDGLVDMFEAAAASGDPLPYYLLCNVDWNATDQASIDVHNAMEKCNLRDYVILEKNGVRIGMMGVIGKDAIECAPTAELSFLDQAESVQRTIDQMEAEGGADIYICISHSGTVDDLEKSEDVILAKKVPQLDLIVSAHSHTILTDEITVGNTYIVSCGCYGQNIGVVSLGSNQNGRWNLNEYDLVSMDSSIEEDTAMLDILESYDLLINESYLREYGVKAQDILAYNEVTFCSVDDGYFTHTEQNLGQFMADAYRYAAGNTPVGQMHPIDMSVAPAGTIRATYPKGYINTQKVFESFSLGEGFDNSIGYPLIDFYISGKEIKTVCEIDASVSDLMNAARLYTSGVGFTYNPNRIILNRVTDVGVIPDLYNDEWEQLDETKLYHVVTDLYSGQMLGAVTDMSYGILAVHPLDENGVELPKLDGQYDFSSRCVYDEDGKELKAWYAIKEYMTSFEKNEDGISVIPLYYDQPSHNRKNIDSSMNVLKLLSHPNKIAIFLYLMILIFLAIVVFMVFVVYKAIRAVKKR